MLDLHVHVLPGIDDGPRTLEDALALARALADDGIEHVVATPHIYQGVFDNTPGRIAEAFDQLQAAMIERDIPLTMTWAAEVRICPEIIDWLEHRRLPLLNGGLVGPASVLIELPDGQIPVGTDRLMALLIDRGITPLIAHPERNKAVMEQPARLEALRRLGCKFQVTAGSVLGDFGTKAHTTARALLDAGWVDVLATDAHNRSSRRPRLSAARAWVTEQYDAALAERLCVAEPTAISGVGSFTMQSGADRLVFRDLPASGAPADLDANWSANLVLDNLDVAPPEAAYTKDRDLSGDSWSLTDFRIDSVLDNLREVTLDNGLGDLGPGMTAAPPDSAPGSAFAEEDWLLPALKPASPAPVPASRRKESSPRSNQAPATQKAPVPAPAPAPAVATPPASAAPAPVRPVQASVQPPPPAPPRPITPPSPPPPPVSVPVPEPVMQVTQEILEARQPVTAFEPTHLRRVLRSTRPVPAHVVTLPLDSAIPTLTRIEPAWSVEDAQVHEPPPERVEAPTSAPAPAPTRREPTLAIAAPEVIEAPIPQPAPDAPPPTAKGLRLSDLATLAPSAAVVADPAPVRRATPVASASVSAEFAERVTSGRTPGGPSARPALATALGTRPQEGPRLPVRQPSPPPVAQAAAPRPQPAPATGGAPSHDDARSVRGFRLSDLTALPPMNRR